MIFWSSGGVKVTVEESLATAQIVPYVGDNQDYSQTLTGLQMGHTYSVHVQVWLTTLQIMVLQIISFQAKFVYLYSFFKLIFLKYIILLLSNNILLDIVSYFSFTSSNHNTCILYNLDFRWNFEVQAANPSGETQWSRTETAQTQTNGEIIEYEYEVNPTDRRTAVQKMTNNMRGTRAQIGNLQPYTRYNVKAPPFVRVINTGADNAHLVWQSPHPYGGYVDKYKCKYGVTGTKQFQERQFPAHSPCQQRMIERQQLPPTPPGARLHCGRIDKLQPEQTYDFQVSAHVQNGGWSPWSEPERTRVTEQAVNVLSVDKIAGTESSLTVAWNVRPDDRSRVTSFQLHIQPVDGSSRPQTFNVDRTTYQYSTTMWTDAATLTALAVAPRVIAEEATSITIEWDSRNTEAGGFIVEYSPWSAEQSITTRQGAPGSVRDLRVKAVSPNEVHVQWLAPLVQRGTIVGYDISYRLKNRLACPEEEPRDVSRDFVTVYNHKDLDYTITGLLPYSLYEDDWAKLERQIANTSDTKITIDGLTPFTKYIMRVKAYNSIGGGKSQSIFIH
uniref:Fibronectin type-III domain-containing protein n=1 Tax=Heterorhabditis bacteriophora TaxID=37862 RepID=A0A1I7XTB5_HETBA